MKSHYVHPTGAAASITAGIIYTACAAFVSLWPAQAIRFFNDWFHGIDITRIATSPTITIAGFLRGLLEVLVFAYLAGALYALLYQKCEEHCRRRKWIR